MSPAQPSMAVRKAFVATERPSHERFLRNVHRDRLRPEGVDGYHATVRLLCGNLVGDLRDQCLDAIGRDLHPLLEHRTQLWKDDGLPCFGLDLPHEIVPVSVGDLPGPSLHAHPVVLIAHLDHVDEGLVGEVREPQVGPERPAVVRELRTGVGPDLPSCVRAARLVHPGGIDHRKLLEIVEVDGDVQRSCRLVLLVVGADLAHFHDLLDRLIGLGHRTAPSLDSAGWSESSGSRVGARQSPQTSRSARRASSPC